MLKLDEITIAVTGPSGSGKSPLIAELRAFLLQRFGGEPKFVEKQITTLAQNRFKGLSQQAKIVATQAAEAARDSGLHAGDGLTVAFLVAYLSTTVLRGDEFCATCGCAFDLVENQ